MEKRVEPVREGAEEGRAENKGRKVDPQGQHEEKYREVMDAEKRRKARHHGKGEGKAYLRGLCLGVED